MAEQGRKTGRQGWLETALGWLRGPQPQYPSTPGPQAWHPVQPQEDATERQAAILAQVRTQEPRRFTVPLVATPQTSPQIAEAERTAAAHLERIQAAIMAEQRRQQQWR